MHVTELRDILVRKYQDVGKLVRKVQEIKRYIMPAVLAQFTGEVNTEGLFTWSLAFKLALYHVFIVTGPSATELNHVINP